MDMQIRYEFNSPDGLIDERDYRVTERGGLVDVFVVLRREYVRRDRAVRACVNEHDLHQQRREFEAVIGADARVGCPGLKHGAHALGDVPGVHGVCPIISPGVAAEDVDDDELLAHVGAHLAPVDGLFEPAHRVYRRRREVGFVAVLCGNSEKRDILFRFFWVKWAAPLSCRHDIYRFGVSGWFLSPDLPTRDGALNSYLGSPLRRPRVIFM